MDITLEIPPPALFEVFETKTVSAGIIHTIPIMYNWQWRSAA